MHVYISEYPCLVPAKLNLTFLFLFCHLILKNTNKTNLCWSTSSIRFSLKPHFISLQRIIVRMSNPPPEKNAKMSTRSSGPPGLEMLLEVRYPAEGKNPFAAIALAIHWSIVRTTNLRLEVEGSEQGSEIPRRNWLEEVVENDPKASSRYLPFRYRNYGTKKVWVVKIQELVDGMVAVLVIDPEEDEDKQFDNDPRVIVVETGKYVNVKAVREGKSQVEEVYYVQKLWALEGDVKGVLFKDEEDTRKIDEFEKAKDPYGSNLTDEQKERLQRERDAKELKFLREEREKAKRRYEESLRSKHEQQQPPNPLILPRNPYAAGGIGRSDLDPFSGLPDAGGMLMDPRGFRRPQMPGGIPGARFDPFGPVGPFGPGGGFGMGGRGVGGGGSRAPGIPFGMPDPDHERSHGYDDMFS